MHLSQANKELQNSLIPRSQELAEYLAKLSRQFEELRARVLKLAESFAIPTPTPEEIFSLKALESLLHDVTEAQKKKAEGESGRQQALRVLDRVLAITHRDCIDFQPLLECHAQASELRRVVTKVQVSDLHPDIKALAEGQHPFLQLLTLIEYQDELDDDRCTFLQECVAKSLSKQLSVAALRGKLIISADARSETPSSSSAPSSFLTGTAKENPTALRYLIWQLLREDKLGLAFHLARCLEIQSPSLQPRLPSWLMRALVLGRNMRYDVGSVEITKTLMTDFSNSSDSCFVDGEGEWNQAVSLLLAASALRPALLAPNTGASEILYSLRLGEDLNQLHEYCQTIANYGAQLQPLDAIALKKVKDQVAWQQALDDLRQRVEDWCSFEAPKKTMNFAHATYVWRNWLESGRLIHSLLLPVNQNDLTRLEAVKQEVKRLSDDAEIKREVDYTDRKVLQRLSGEDIQLDALSELCRHLGEAVEFVRCWIELQEYQQESSNDYFQQQAQQLKQAVSNRQKAVLKELNSFEQRNSSVLLLAGVYCCRTAVEDIQDSFRSRRAATNGRA